MKIYCYLTVPVILSSVCDGFSVVPSKSTTTTTQLQAVVVDRREIFTAATSLTLSAAALMVPEAAFAAEFVPKVKDMEQIYCKCLFVLLLLLLILSS